MKKNKKEIKNILVKRNIEHLVHFTNVKNVESIMQNGIIPVKNHKEYNVTAFVNDKIRDDELMEMTSFSVEFPNYKMLSKLKLNYPEEEWVIFFLRSSIILDKTSLFCYDNASNKEIKELSKTSRQEYEMFEKMFSDIDGYPLRAKTRLKRYFTTSPQAEILIEGNIDLNYIEKIVFLTAESKNKNKKLVPSFIKQEVIPDYFFAREDIEFLKGEKDEIK
ncbi:MAG: DarT ssDNA thymidine ADP-ribosyltransferase family protein [Carnobacterium maltaromaticum]